MNDAGPPPEEIARRRFWGALVALAIAGVGALLLLDGSGTTRHDRNAVVDALTDGGAGDVQRGDRDEHMGRGSGAGDGASAGSPTDAAATPVPDGRDAAAWVIEVAAYQRRAGAVDLRDKLRRAGLPSFVREPRSGGGLFRVLVGPIIGRARADEVATAVAERLDRRVRLRRYASASRRD